MSTHNRPCEICGQPIDPERLEAVPDTRLCGEPRSQNQPSTAANSARARHTIALRNRAASRRITAASALARSATPKLSRNSAKSTSRKKSSGDQ